MNALNLSACAMLASASMAVADTTVDFESGPQGWSIQNQVTIEPVGGNPGAYLDHFQIDTFGITIANTTSLEFLGDYGAKGPVSVSMDIQVTRIWDQFFGDVSREIVVEFRDYDSALPGYPWASVWYSLGILETGMDWTNLKVDINDPLATALPPGWGGYGDEDPNTFEPILPAGVTFADIMAGVDEVAFTTFVPGFFFGFTNYDIGVDNISIVSQAVPCPADIAPEGGDGMVGTDDFFALLQNWGACADPANCPWDIVGDDDVVGTDDFFALLQSWGPCDG